MGQVWKKGQLVFNGYGVVESGAYESRDEALREIVKRIDNGDSNLSLTEYKGNWYVIKYIR